MPASSVCPCAACVAIPGSAAGWQNHRLRASTAFVVELPPGRPASRLVRRAAAAVLAVGRPLDQLPGQITEAVQARGNIEQIGEAYLGAKGFQEQFKTLWGK